MISLYEGGLFIVYQCFKLFRTNRDKYNIHQILLNSIIESFVSIDNQCFIFLKFVIKDLV